MSDMTIVVASTHERAARSADFLGLKGWMYAHTSYPHAIGGLRDFTLVICGFDLTELRAWDVMVRTARIKGGSVAVIHD